MTPTRISSITTRISSIKSGCSSFTRTFRAYRRQLQGKDVDPSQYDAIFVHPPRTIPLPGPCRRPCTDSLLPQGCNQAPFGGVEILITCSFGATLFPLVPGRDGPKYDGDITFNLLTVGAFTKHLLRSKPCLRNLSDSALHLPAVDCPATRC